jgi:hypothetical protein
MLYNTWSHWLSGLYPSSEILNTKKKQSFRKGIQLYSSPETLFSRVQNSRNSVTPTVIYTMARTL